MSKLKILLILATSFLLIMVLQMWRPWQRQPVVFYEAIIFPMEVLKGDIIIATDNSSYYLVPYNETINQIEYDGNKVTIHATRHLTIWDAITGG